MNGISKSAAAGAAGALTTTVLHEMTRHVVPNAPRVDLLGMQGIARIAKGAGARPATGKRLFSLTMAADLMSNGGYFSLVGLAPKSPMTAGVLLGLAAGVGGVILPRKLGFDAKTTARTRLTQALTVALYAMGGIAAGVTYRVLD